MYSKVRSIPNTLAIQDVWMIRLFFKCISISKPCEAVVLHRAMMRSKAKASGKPASRPEATALRHVLAAGQQVFMSLVLTRLPGSSSCCQMSSLGTQRQAFVSAISTTCRSKAGALPHAPSRRPPGAVERPRPPSAPESRPWPCSCRGRGRTWGAESGRPPRSPQQLGAQRLWPPCALVPSRPAKACATNLGRSRGIL